MIGVLVVLVLWAKDFVSSCLHMLHSLLHLFIGFLKYWVVWIIGFRWWISLSLCVCVSVRCARRVRFWVWGSLV